MSNNPNSTIRTVYRRSNVFGLSWRTTLSLICLCIPALIIAGAYFHMVFRYQNLWLFNTIVHENGKYTLLEVIFYFRHFLWELPIKAWYSIVLAGLFFYYGQPPLREKQVKEASISYFPIFAFGFSAIGIAGIALIVTGENKGYHEALIGLSQYLTSELRSPLFGSHWRNHFLSNIVLVSTSAAFILLFRYHINGGWIKRKFAGVFPFAVTIFITFTLLFGVNMDPFIKPSYLGHQLREIFGTDLPITMTLSLGLLFYLEGKYDFNCHVQRKHNPRDRRITLRHLMFWSVIASVVSAFLIFKVLSLDTSAEIAKIGQTKNWSILDLFAWHFFEHSLDYFFTLSFVAFIYLLLLKIEQMTR